MRGRIHSSLQVRRFAQEFAIVFQALGVDRIPNGATGLSRVRAICEPAGRRALGDVVERAADGRCVAPELKFAHAGRIDQRGTAG